VIPTGGFCRTRFSPLRRRKKTKQNLSMKEKQNHLYVLPLVGTEHGAYKTR
jgi:hypothetical protein